MSSLEHSPDTNRLRAHDVGLGPPVLLIHHACTNGQVSTGWNMNDVERLIHREWATNKTISQTWLSFRMTCTMLKIQSSGKVIRGCWSEMLWIIYLELYNYMFITRSWKSTRCQTRIWHCYSHPVNIWCWILNGPENLKLAPCSQNWWNAEKFESRHAAVAQLTRWCLFELVNV